MLYKKLEVDETTPVQFLGVYVTKWRPGFGEPTAAFVEVDYSLADAEDDLLYVILDSNSAIGRDEAREEIRAIFKKLVGEEK